MSAFTEVPGKHVADITVYALSYCPYCKATKEFLKEHDVEYKYVDVDTAPPQEAEQLMSQVQEYNPDETFPTIVVDGGKEVIVGFNEPAIEKVIAA
ncbi:MAG: glutaredoxin family protein [Clostridia bacterium]|nr:glutaredoxin family protein [Clostridia bacterium]